MSEITMNKNEAEYWQERAIIAEIAATDLRAMCDELASDLQWTVKYGDEIPDSLAKYEAMKKNEKCAGGDKKGVDE